MQRNSAFSSVRGKIEKLLLCADGEEHFPRIAAILSKMPDHCQTVVWCNEVADADHLEQYLIKQGYNPSDMAQSRIGGILPTDKRCLILLPQKDETTHSRWTRDPFFCWFDGQEVEILRSFVEKGDNDTWAENHLVGAVFSNGLRVRLSQSKIPVAGGNLLLDEDFVLAGAKQLVPEGQSSQQAIQNLLDLFNGLGYGTFNRAIAVGGDLIEPNLLVHLDLYLSLGGGATDATYGAYPLLLAECFAAEDPPDEALSNILVGLKRYLNAVEHDLKKAGFHIIRNPVPVFRYNDDVCLAAYNNCLCEVTTAGKQVWLPRVSFGQENASYYSALMDAEAKNEALWVTLGFQVHWIETDFVELLDQYGALHCIANEWLRA